MANLAKERLTPEDPPFERNGCVFTCLMTRFVRIEITTSLDTGSLSMLCLDSSVSGETQRQFTVTMVPVSAQGNNKCIQP